MAYNKVVVNGETIIDLTGSNVDAAHLLAGYTAHDKSGNLIEGTIPDRGIDDVVPSTSKVTIPIGAYSKGLNIHFQGWSWDELNFETDIVTEATGVSVSEES